MLQQVWLTGVDDVGEEIPAELVVDGRLQRYYFDYEYRAIRNNQGEVYAIMHTAMDVTERVKNKEVAILHASLFRRLVEQAPVAITVLQGEQLIIDIVNPRMLEIWGKKSSILGKPLAIAMPELEGQPFIGILLDVLRTGIPFYGRESWAQIERAGKIVEGYFNFDCQPMRDTENQITGVLQVVTEVTDLVRSRMEIQQTKTMMDLAINAANLGSWQIEPGSRKLVYNEALVRMYGYQGTEPMTFDMAIGQVSEEYQGLLIKAIEVAIEERSEYDITFSQRRFDNDELIWLRSFGKIGGAPESQESFSGFVMDVTQAKRDEQRKNDFIGMVSHELKTPLTSLSGYIQLLRRNANENSNTFATKMAGSAASQLAKMTAMINGFLNLSRLESGKLVLEMNQFDMAALLEEIIAEQAVTSGSHQIIFSERQSVFVNADRIKIGSVVSNLLNNAIKYSPHAKEIMVSCRQIQNQVEVCVTDKGIGISSEHIERIFDRFYRVETAFISGFGIGLYLSAEVINRHGGRIWVDSKPGEGATFCFRIQAVG